MSLVESEIRELREDSKQIMEKVSSLSTLLEQVVNRDIARIDSRLDKHSERLDGLEKTQHQVITTKNMVVWIISTMLSSVAIAVSVAKWVLTGG